LSLALALNCIRQSYLLLSHHLSQSYLRRPIGKILQAHWEVDIESSPVWDISPIINGVYNSIFACAGSTSNELARFNRQRILLIAYVGPGHITNRSAVHTTFSKNYVTPPSPSPHCLLPYVIGRLLLAPTFTIVVVG